LQVSDWFQIEALAGGVDAKDVKAPAPPAAAPKRKAPDAASVAAAEKADKKGRTQRTRSFVFTVNLDGDSVTDHHARAERLHAALLAEDRVRDSIFSIEKATRYVARPAFRSAATTSI
jgi:hypothetical protein